MSNWLDNAPLSICAAFVGAAGISFLWKAHQTNKRCNLVEKTAVVDIAELKETLDQHHKKTGQDHMFVVLKGHVVCHSPDQAPRSSDGKSCAVIVTKVKRTLQTGHAGSELQREEKHAVQSRRVVPFSITSPNLNPGARGEARILVDIPPISGGLATLILESSKVQSQIVDAAELERVRLLFPPLPPRTLNVKYFKHEEYLPDLSTAFCLGEATQNEKGNLLLTRKKDSPNPLLLSTKPEGKLAAELSDRGSFFRYIGVSLTAIGVALVCVDIGFALQSAKPAAVSPSK